MRPSTLFLPALAAFAVTSCKNQKPAAQGPPPMPEVSVLTLTAAPAGVLQELPGRINAPRTAEVRARVPGILLQKCFTEGAEVKEGDVLFRIDPAPLQAAFDNAQAAKAKSEANLAQAKTQLDRYQELVRVNAVSKQAFDNARAAVQALEADVQATQAAVQTAELNFGYATVRAPISGRIGRALVTEGALVGQGETTQLALIQQLDPIYVDFTQSTADLLKLRRALEAGTLQQTAPDQAKAGLLLDGGSLYEHQGALLFSEANVDPSTGMVRMRAEFANPKKLLLPGMFARIRLTQAVDAHAILVPQRAVTRAPGGKGRVIVVDAQQKASPRMITTDRAVGDQWVVSEGLQAGETIAVEGNQKVMQPGTPVKTVPYAPQPAAPNSNTH